jgi:Cd2+/Zn2+-exporting ATPase
VLFRSSAASAVKGFNGLGITETAILSGDHERSVDRVARTVGVLHAHSSLKPKEKMDIIRDYQARNLPVMYVGDGINDAPALASAHVGVAMAAAGTDVALETADIALVNDGIERLPWLVALSRRMLAIIKINIAFGLGFNALAVLLSGMGWLSPVMAAVVHNIGSVLVVMASASLAFVPDNGEAQTLPAG